MTAVPRDQPSRARQALPPLENGARLTRAEFERRYEAMPHVHKAELIEGIVYMPSPVSQDYHGGPHNCLNGWIWVYVASTPGTSGGSDSTLRLDLDNEPQPDVHLRIKPECSGQSRTSDKGGFIEGAPELVVEVAATSASRDMHAKLNAYRRNGVREYIVWRVLDEALDWFVLRDDAFRPLEPDRDGVLKSEVFPGLWLDPAALVRDDMARVLAVLQQGLSSPAHAQLVAELQSRRKA